MGRSMRAGMGGGYDAAPRKLFETPHWYACRTRSRSEKVADRALKRAGIEAYLPLLEEDHQWADRVKRVDVPLLPGYVFARCTLREMGNVLRAPRVVSVVRVNGYPTPVRQREMDAVRSLVRGANASGRLPTPADYLQPGEAVRVTEGPFRGLEGVLLEERSGYRVAVRIDALRAARAVEMDRSVLRPAGGAASAA